MPFMRLARVAFWLSSVVLASSAAVAAAPDPETTRPQSYEFIAWSEDSSQFLIKINDPNMTGCIFQVRDTETGAIVKNGKKNAQEIAPDKEAEVKARAKIIKAYKMTQAPVDDASHPKKKDIMLFMGQKGERLVIMGMRGERASKYDTIDVMKDKQGVAAKANQKQLVWDADGSHLAIIYRAKLDNKDTPFEGDFIYVAPFKESKVKKAAPAEDGEKNDDE